MDKIDEGDVYDLEELLARMEHSKDDWWVYASEITALRRAIELLKEMIND